MCWERDEERAAGQARVRAARAAGLFSLGHPPGAGRLVEKGHDEKRIGVLGAGLGASAAVR